MTADNILVVDDDPSFRALVTALLESAGLECREADSAAAAVELAKRHRPALVVLDVLLPDVSGFEVCRQLREEFGEALPIIFLSGEKIDAVDRAAGLLVGGDAYLVKPFHPDEFLARVRRELRRTQAAEIDERVVPSLGADLTNRERQILMLLAEGQNRPAIARELVISPKTVDSHVQRLLSKLGVHSQAQAVAVAYRNGLIGAGENEPDVVASAAELYGEAVAALD